MAIHIEIKGALVENMAKKAKKNRSRFPIAVLLTTMSCSHITTTKFHFSLCDCKFKCLGACDILLDRYFHDLSNGLLKDLKYLKCQLVS